MPELCARLNDETSCMPVDLTVFDDPRQGDVTEAPGEAPGRLETSGVSMILTTVAWGAIPDAWPRDERVPAELVKGNDRVPCELVVRAPTDGDKDTGGGAELLLIGKEVFRAVLGRDP